MKKIVIAKVAQNLILGRKSLSAYITSRKNNFRFCNSRTVRRMKKCVMAKIAQNSILSRYRDSADGDVKTSTQYDLAVSGNFI